MSKRMLIAVALCACTSLATTSAQTPLGAEFTYQGQLQRSGTPLNSTADFEFKLFDAATGGTQQGSTNPINNVNIVDGLFTVSLNFGTPAFGGDQRFLQIAVRIPAGSGTFTTLSPRQPMTAVPYALYALSGPGSQGPWAVSGANVFNTNAGNVGLGTATPSAALHIAPVTDPVMILQDTGFGPAQTGYVSFWNNAGAETGWVGFGSPSNPHLSISNARNGGDVALFSGTGGSIRLGTNTQALTVNSAGRVGIGTTAPATKLDVRGDIHLGSTGQFFAPAGEEKLRIIRGNVDGTGAITAGAGFSCQRIQEGVYQITFTNTFAAVPTMDVTVFVAFSGGGPDDPVFAHIESLSQTTAMIRVLNRSAISPETNSDFSFCAIGPR